MPEKAKKPRRETRNDTMPPLSEGGYLVGILYEIGPVHPLGMGGTGAITDQDLRAWQANQGVALSPWECSTLRDLSRQYASQLAESQAANCPPPWVPPSVLNEEHRKRISEGMQSWSSKLNAQRSPKK